MLGNYQKAIDDYYLALEVDSKRKTVYRNIGRVLGLNTESGETDRTISNDNNQSYISNNNLNIDGEINHYVYKQLNDLAIRSSSFEANKIKSDGNYQFSKKPESFDTNNNHHLINNNNSNNNSNSVLISSKPINTKKISNGGLSDQSYSAISNNITSNNLSNYNNQNFQSNEDFEGEVADSSKSSINMFKSIENKKKEDLRSILDPPKKDKEKKKSLEKWEAYHSQGYAARKKENFPLAIELYTKALTMNNKYFKVFFLTLGIVQ